jgi:hypothetical protein
MKEMMMMMMMSIIITLYNEIQYKICFSVVIGFIKKSTSLNTRFAAKMHLAVGEFLLEAKDKEWFLKLHKGAVIPVASKRDGQHFRPE